MLQYSTEFKTVLMTLNMKGFISTVLFQQPRYCCEVTLDGNGILEELLEDDDDELLDEDTGAVNGMTRRKYNVLEGLYVV